MGGNITLKYDQNESHAACAQVVRAESNQGEGPGFHSRRAKMVNFIVI